MALLNLCRRLAASGVTRVKVDYAAGEKKDLTTVASFMRPDGRAGGVAGSEDLAAQLGRWVLGALDDLRPGWDRGGGSVGEVSLDVRGLRATFDHRPDQASDDRFEVVVGTGGGR